MYKKKISVIFNNVEENIKFQNDIFELGGKSKIESVDRRRFSGARILTLELIKNQYVFSHTNVLFTSEGEKYIEKLRELEKDSYLVNFKTLKSMDYEKDFKNYDRTYRKEKALDEWTNYIIWRLESCSTKLYDNLKDTREDNILYNGNKIDTLKFIEITDNVKLLKFCIENEFILKQFKSDPLYLTFDENKNPKCYSYIEDLKREVNYENLLEREMN